jgi:Family of unknown function (DUF6644)
MSELAPRQKSGHMFLVNTLSGIPGRLPLNPIARWEWVFPVVEAIHICGLTLLVGSVVILDLRLLGLRLRSEPVSGLAKELSPWIWLGIIIQLTTGPYLFSGDPHEYVQVAAFRNKMLFLLLALVFHFTVIRRATAPSADSSPLGWRRPAALVSLGLWFCVLLAGLWIGNL